MRLRPLTALGLGMLVGLLLAACGETSPSSGLLSSAPPEVPDRLRVEVLDRRPHRTDAFTQGFELSDGRLFESTGLVGQSSLRELDPISGAVLRSMAIEDPLFAEGLTAVGDRLVQLTWQNGVALVHDRDTFERLGQFSYTGEGWGLCHDGTRLVMSDGSSSLQFRDPETFELLTTVPVRAGGEPVVRLNELECVGESVYANVWMTHTIVQIHAGTGAVLATVDASALADEVTASGNVLNGIAHDPSTGNFLITGKRWDEMFEVRFVPA